MGNSLERHFRHDAGQAHASDSRVKQFRILFGRTNRARAVRANYRQLSHMLPKRAGVVMVLAMNVCGYTATQRHELCSRYHRREPAPGKKCLNYLSQRSSGFRC